MKPPSSAFDNSFIINFVLYIEHKSICFWYEYIRANDSCPCKYLFHIYKMFKCCFFPQFRVALRLTPGDWYEIFSEPSSIIATSPGGLPTSPPRILTATPVSSSIISVIWEEGEFTNGPVISYILQVNEIPVGYAAVRVRYTKIKIVWLLNLKMFYQKKFFLGHPRFEKSEFILDEKPKTIYYIFDYYFS